MTTVGQVAEHATTKRTQELMESERVWAPFQGSGPGAYKTGRRGAQVAEGRGGENCLKAGIADCRTGTFLCRYSALNPKDDWGSDYLWRYAQPVQRLRDWHCLDSCLGSRLRLATVE